MLTINTEHPYERLLRRGRVVAAVEQWPPRPRVEWTHPSLRQPLKLLLPSTTTAPRVWQQKNRRGKNYSASRFNSQPAPRQIIKHRLLSLKMTRFCPGCKVFDNLLGVPHDVLADNSNEMPESCKSSCNAQIGQIGWCTSFSFFQVQLGGQCSLAWDPEPGFDLMLESWFEWVRTVAGPDAAWRRAAPLVGSGSPQPISDPRLQQFCR